MAERDLVWIGLGSNEGDREAHLGAATATLAALSSRELVVSPIYETEPWGVADQPAFLNGVVGLAFGGTPGELLAALQGIEAAAARLRTRRWGPRTLDLDLLVWPALVLDDPDLQLPHPRLAQRRFVLAPLADVAPDLEVPGLDATVSELLERCDDPGRVSRLG